MRVVFLLVAFVCIGCGDDVKNVPHNEPDELTAKRLCIVDDNGKIKMELCVIKGSPSLRLYDKNGEIRLGLAITESGPVILLVSEDDKIEMELSVIKDDSALRIRNKDGKSGRFGTTVALINGEPSVAMINKNGKTLFLAPR